MMRKKWLREATLSRAIAITGIPTNFGQDADVEETLHAKVRDALLEADCPLSVPEVAKALVELGLFQMATAIGKETLRSAIGRKPEIFAYVGGRKVTLRIKGLLAEAE
jgi:hypothetical protein